MTSDSDIAEMFEWIESNADLGKVDVCVPNAGFAAASSLLDGETALLTFYATPVQGDRDRRPSTSWAYVLFTPR